MQIDDILSAIVEIVKQTLNATVVAGEVKRPIKRDCAKINVLPYSVNAGCDGQREHSIDVDIFYYPVDTSTSHMRSIANTLSNALCEGFDVCDTWLMPDDDISSEITDEVLVVQFTLSYTESAVETGEFMENIYFNKEELTNGD